MTLRDCNDLSRRPAGPGQRTVAANSASSSRAFVGETPEDIAKRHAESSPENPQGGRWVKFRITGPGGAVLSPGATRTALAAMGYRGEGKPDGD